MKILKIGLPIVVGLAVLVLLLAPLGPLPGVFIGGNPTTPPEVWEDTADVDEIRLKVPGVVPRVVIIWVIDHQGELHVVGSSDSGWVRQIGAGTPVEMRLGDDTYALNAVPVEGAEWQPVLEAYVAKYEPSYPDIVASFPPIEEAPGQVSVFRLDRG